MSTRLYVGNLPYSTTPNELREMFTAHGEVTDAHVVMDRETGRSRGFGFVTMATEEQAQAAARALNDQRVGGRPLVVNEARERGAGPPPRGGPGGAPRSPRPPREAGGPPGPARDDRPPAPARPPRPPRAPLVQEPMEIPSEEPRRRPRSPGRKQEHDREPNRVRPDEEDDFSGVSNWREFLDEQEDPKDDLNPVKEVFSGDEDEEIDDDDWRRYVDNDEDAGSTTLGDELRGGSKKEGSEDDPDE